MTVFMFIFSTRSDRRCGCIPNATAIKGHVNDFLFYTEFVCRMGVDQLKTTRTVFAFVAGPPVRLMTVGAEAFMSDSIFIAAVAARNDESCHAVKTISLQLRHDQVFYHFVGSD